MGPKLGGSTGKVDGGRRRDGSSLATRLVASQAVSAVRRRILAGRAWSISATKLGNPSSEAVPQGTLMCDREWNSLGTRLGGSQSVSAAGKSTLAVRWSMVVSKRENHSSKAVPKGSLIEREREGGSSLGTHLGCRQAGSAVGRSTLAGRACLMAASKRGDPSSEAMPAGSLGVCEGSCLGTCLGCKHAGSAACSLKRADSTLRQYRYGRRLARERWELARDQPVRLTSLVSQLE